MKESKIISILLLFFIIILPSVKTSAQNTVTLENFFGEGSFMDGYDFSAYGIQRWGEGGPDNPNLSPDFYLGDSNTPVTTTSYHSPKPTIEYGTTSISSITEIPAQSDSRFGSHAFVQGHTYGLFTLEGNYVVLNIQNIYQQPYEDYVKNGVTFQWMYVEAGPVGNLTLSLYPFDKPEFALGENPTIGGDVLVGGKPLSGEDVCIEVTGEGGQFMLGACFTTNTNGQFSFRLEYGNQIPEGYRGDLIVRGDVAYKEQVVVETIYVPYGGAEYDQPLKMDLWGPTVPIVISSNTYVEIGGTLTSNGVPVDEAEVVMTIGGQTFKTTTGLYDTGKFYWSWVSTTLPAGVNTVFVTVSKMGYQTVTGQVSFTLAGEGYNFWVTMDTIPPLLDPGDQIPFPGTLTLAGKPFSDWIEIDITFPNGVVNTYSHQTGADGRFTHVQPSMIMIGTYTLAVYHHTDRSLISSVYTFAVGAVSTPTPEPTSIPLPKTWEIVEVQYPSQIELGGNFSVKGKLIYEQGGKTFPQEGFWVQTNVNRDPVQTDQNGAFTLNLVVDLLELDNLILTAGELESYPSGRAHWFGPLKVFIPISPIIELNYSDYDLGEVMDGLLKFQPTTDLPDWTWAPTLDITYQVVGPVGGTEMSFFFKSTYPIYNQSQQFQWLVPGTIQGGPYRITAFISGDHVVNSQAEANFFINDIPATILTAFVEPSMDGWTSGELDGEFTDFEGGPIVNAEIRVVFKEEKEPYRDFTLNGTTDSNGKFKISLEPLDLFSAEGQENPWEKRNWITTVYGDKEGYATGATILTVVTPTLLPHLEIIAIDPPLNYFEGRGGTIQFEQMMDMNITLRVRYNNIFDGAKMDFTAAGMWAVSGSAPKCEFYKNKAHLNVNGEPKPGLIYPDDYYLAYNYELWPSYYPLHSVEVPIQRGSRQEALLTVSGKLFGYSSSYSSKTSPNPCGGAGPPDPNPNIVRYPNYVVGLRVCIGKICHRVGYSISPSSIKASGTAWVSANDGNLDLKVGNKSGYWGLGMFLANHPVNLAIVAKDVLTGEEVTRDQITVQASGRTDENGNLSLPLQSKSNPCELEFDANYFVKVTSQNLIGEALIPIELRCVGKLDFMIEPDEVYLVQAIEFPQDEDYRLVAGKEAGVRVKMWVDGEIYQPESKPVNFNVKMELLQPGTDKPLISQTKTVSLNEKNATVKWTEKARAINQAGIGTVAKWEEQPTGVEGTEQVPIDFVFTPSAPSGKGGDFKIRITVDPDGIWGKPVQQEIKGKVYNMKTLNLKFILVDIYENPHDFISTQSNFLLETYPLGMSNLVIDPNLDFFGSDRLYKSCTSVSYLKRIACSLGAEYGKNGQANFPNIIVGIVESSVWVKDSYEVLLISGMKSSVGAYTNNFWDSTTQNVVLIRYPFNVANTTSHEIGHLLGLHRDKEQYALQKPHGYPVHGLVLRNSKIIDIDEIMVDKLRGKGTGFVNVEEVYDLMGNAGYSYDDAAEDFNAENIQESWIVWDTCKKLFDALVDPPEMDIFYLQGIIQEDGSATLLPLVKTKGIPDEQSKEGDFQLQVQSTSGEVLYATYFGASGKTDLFNLFTPNLPGMGRVVLLQEDRVLTEVVRSLNPPEVNFTSVPPEINHPDDLMGEGKISLSWDASDLDEDSLSYNLSYLCNEDIHWTTLKNNLTTNTYDVSYNQLPGGMCTFQVIVSDGINSSQTVSDAYMVPLQPPKIDLLIDRTTYPVDESILLQVFAYDPNDGFIPNENLRWFSDLDGELGYGRSLVVNLSQGKHTVTLVAEHSLGHFSEENFTIEVVEEIEKEQPTPTSQVIEEQTDSEEEQEEAGWMGYAFIIAIVLGGLVLVGGGLTTVLVLNRRRKRTAVSNPTPASRQPMRQSKDGVIQDSSGAYWYQDPRTKTWYYWDGREWKKKKGSK